MYAYLPSPRASLNLKQMSNQHSKDAQEAHEGGRRQREGELFVGQRFSISPDRGTIRFIGRVADLPGTWLGVEWDQPTRGKHEGVAKDGKRYFSVRVPGSASFIRPNQKWISFGCSFLSALKSKYAPDEVKDQTNQPSQGQETKIFSRKNLAEIEIEIPNLDSVARRVSRLNKLREVGLGGFKIETEFPFVEEDGEAKIPLGMESYAEVAFALDERLGQQAGDIRKTCPSIKWLDLSRSLLPNWDEVAKIAGELEKLEVLLLHFNRFEPITGLIPSAWGNSFLNLKELRLDGTFMTWDEMLRLSPALPSLELLQLGYNDISTFSAPPTGSPAETTSHDLVDVGATTRPFPRLKILNLSGNKISNWDEVVKGLSTLPELERLILTDNELSTISPPPWKSERQSSSPTGSEPRPAPKPRFPKLDQVVLLDNPIQSWSDLENLDSWLVSESEKGEVEDGRGSGSISTDPKGLRTLVISGERCKLYRSFENVRDFNSIAIARLGNLRNLNGMTIKDELRRDSELYYVSKVLESFLDEDIRGKEEMGRNSCGQVTSKDFPSLMQKVESGVQPIEGWGSEERARRRREEHPRLERLLKLHKVNLPDREEESRLKKQRKEKNTLRSKIVRVKVKVSRGRPLKDHPYLTEGELLRPSPSLAVREIEAGSKENGASEFDASRRADEETEGSRFETLSILPTTSLNLVKSKVCKAFGVKPKDVGEVWALLGAGRRDEPKPPDGEEEGGSREDRKIVFEIQDSSRDLSWYEIGEGDEIVLVLKES
ncbi:RNI-like protein [Violaceomyces palustris]|uniref:RNI-like protein n=1 Tax=Violaceomyces palustris TaxID=1673888 RepID=A0ACD0P7J5_9BASI|nr:RNI-like protein [Violaceomyces palustris]